MSIMEIEIPTGFKACEVGDPFPDPSCLKELSQALGLDYELNSRYVTFYLEEINSYTATCIEFKATKKYTVSHVAPVEAKVFEKSDPDTRCSKFYSPSGASATLALIGCEQSTLGEPSVQDPICICGAGLCPKIKDIDNRLCNVCNHHHYAYKVKVKAIEKKNTWIKHKCKIEQILKPGGNNLKVNDTVLLWMQEVCKMSAKFRVGNVYHIMGLDGEKYILDQNSHIEEWPETIPKYDTGCLKTSEKDCIKKKCRKLKGNRKRSCEKKFKSQCAKKAKRDCVSGFYRYFNSITENPNVCERSDLC
ncbi:ophiophagus venom factor-like [Corticium candelabrum]|uniref:ophiophagus venom factor-like n=1 Tax=Corticium candelabrum TaxID=121492 RepID=UPI002E269882|nr:ophiophagus venom factor-like [Corticium candelabrum]